MDSGLLLKFIGYFLSVLSLFLENLCGNSGMKYHICEPRGHIPHVRGPYSLPSVGLHMVFPYFVFLQR